MFYYDLSEYSKAIEDFSKAIEIMTRIIQLEKSNVINNIDTTSSPTNYNTDTTSNPAKVVKSKKAKYIKRKTVETPEEIITELLVYRATAYTELGNYDKARQDYLQLNCIRPNKPVSMDLLGWNYRKCDMQDSAIFYFKKAIEMDSLDKDALIGLALAYYCNGEYDSSKDVLNLLIGLEPELSRGIIGIKNLEEEYWYTDTEREKIKAMLEFYGYCYY